MVDSTLTIGKYPMSNNDFNNVMKAYKKYCDLTLMHHYNLLSDCDLFYRMETQYLYKQDDVKRDYVMIQFIYQYRQDKELKENEIMICDAYKYVINNMNNLEEWSGKKYSKVLYVSERDSIDSSIFREDNES